MKIYQGPPIPFKVETSPLVESKYQAVRAKYPAIDDVLYDIIHSLEREPYEEGLRHSGWHDREMFILARPGLAGIPKTRWLYEVGDNMVTIWSFDIVE